MKILDTNELKQIAGGYWQAIGAGIGVYTAWPSIADSTAYWGQQGQQFGGWIFDITHPNAGGQMVYTAQDLGLSYIPPFPGFN